MGKSCLCRTSAPCIAPGLSSACPGRQPSGWTDDSMPCMPDKAGYNLPRSLQAGADSRASQWRLRPSTWVTADGGQALPAQGPAPPSPWGPEPPRADVIRLHAGGGHPGQALPAQGPAARCLPPVCRPHCGHRAHACCLRSRVRPCLLNPKPCPPCMCPHSCCEAGASLPKGAMPVCVCQWAALNHAQGKACPRLHPWLMVCQSCAQTAGGGWPVGYTCLKVACCRSRDNVTVVVIDLGAFQDLEPAHRSRTEQQRAGQQQSAT